MTAPDVTRPRPPLIAGEREMLDAWLDFHRATLVHKCAGLTVEQLRERACPPSSLSLLGLVRHMTDVERGWFTGFAGGDRTKRYSSPDNPDGDFDDVDGADPQEAFAAFAEECDTSRSLVAGRDLDETYVHWRGEEISLRWIYVHMIEEYARHNGHADLLRERIDGTVGA
ncbi:MAG TPA: DinB family protein [Micromonosporaceae bacterium]